MEPIECRLVLRMIGMVYNRCGWCSGETRDGEVVRAFASHQCSPSLIPAWCHMWVEFVVCSRLALRVFFPGSPDFLLLQKPRCPISNSTRIESSQWKPAKAHVASSLDIVIYFILIWFMYYIHLPVRFLSVWCTVLILVIPPSLSRCTESGWTG